ncbi:hypothetical protein [Blautia sp.]
MEFYDNEEVCFQQTKRTAKMVICQENIGNIKRINIPDFDDEERDIIKELHRKLLKRSMNKNDSNEVGMLVNLQDWTDIIVNGTEDGIRLKEDKKAFDLTTVARIPSPL